MNEQRLNEIIRHNQELMNNPEYVNKMNEIASTRTPQGQNGGSRVIRPQAAKTQITEQVPNTIGNVKKRGQYEDVRMTDGIMSSIKESFAAIPDLTNDYSTKNLNFITEERKAPVPQGGIDYEYINYIIKKTIQEELEKIVNSLKSVTVTALQVDGHTKIRLLDSDKNLYEGTLKFVKNTKK